MDEELLGETPYGVAVRRGGQVLFLPPSAALSSPISAAAPATPPPSAPSGGIPEALTNPIAGLTGAPPAAPAAPAAPTPDPFAGGAPADVVRPGDVAVSATPAAAVPGGIPSNLTNPLVGLGVEPTAPTPVADPFADGLPDSIVRPTDVAVPGLGVDAISGVGQPVPQAGAAPAAVSSSSTPGSSSGDEDAPDIPTTPYQDEQMALQARGMLAKEKAAEEEKILSARNAAIADKEGQIAKAQRLLDARVEDLTGQYDTAIKARADYNAKISRAPDPHEVSAGKIIAMVMFGLGSVLGRDPRGVQPVIDLLNARAEQEAKRRVNEEERLGGIVKDRAGQLSGVLKMREGLTEKLKIEKAAILEQYARDAEALGKKYEGENAFVEAQRLAAGIRKEALKDGRAAAEKQADQELQAWQTRARIAQDERESQRNAATAAARLAFDTKKWDADLDINKREIAVKEAQLGINQRELDLKASKQQLERDMHLGERRVYGLPQVKLDDKGQPVKDPNGQPVFERQILKNRDGNDFVPPTKEEAVEARQAVYGANKTAQLVDQLLTIIENKGWQSDTVRSKEWLEAKSIYNEIIATRKNEGDLALGVLAGPDMELLGSILGGDPTQIRDPSAALRQARNNVMLGVNAKLVGFGYDGPTFGVTELTPSAQGKPKNTQAQDLLQAAQARGEAGVAGAGGLNAHLLSDEDYKASFGFGSVRGQDPRAFPTRSASAAIAELGRVVANKNTSPADREQHLAALRELANDPSPVVQNRVRTMAAQLKIDLGDQYIPPKVGAGKAVSSEGVPKDLLESLKKAEERGTPGAAGIASGLKNLTAADRQRVIDNINKKGEDRAENFPTARANVAIGRLIEAAVGFEDPKVQAWAQQELERLALTDPSPIVRRRIRRAAKEKGFVLRGGDAAASGAAGAVGAAIQGD